jgi:hypothetical protein
MQPVTKPTTVATALLTTLLLAGHAYGAPKESEESIALKKFKSVVSHYEKFFATKPVLLKTTINSYSKSGYVYTYRKFEARDFSYDVKKNDSLVSPFMGYITLSFKAQSNGSCGDYIGDKKPVGFTSANEAEANKNNSSCYTSDNDLSDTSELVFAYQDGKWVFKNAHSTIYPLTAASTVLSETISALETSSRR